MPHTLRAQAAGSGLKFVLYCKHTGRHMGGLRQGLGKGRWAGKGTLGGGAGRSRSRQEPLCLRRACLQRLAALAWLGAGKVVLLAVEGVKQRVQPSCSSNRRGRAGQRGPWSVSPGWPASWHMTRSAGATPANTSSARQWRSGLSRRRQAGSRAAPTLPPTHPATHPPVMYQRPWKFDRSNLLSSAHSGGSGYSPATQAGRHTTASMVECMAGLRGLGGCACPGTPAWLLQASTAPPLCPRRSPSLSL